jgi:hypothetical protein
MRAASAPGGAILQGKHAGSSAKNADYSGSSSALPVSIFFIPMASVRSESTLVWSDGPKAYGEYITLLAVRPFESQLCELLPLSISPNTRFFESYILRPPRL